MNESTPIYTATNRIILTDYGKKIEGKFTANKLEKPSSPSIFSKIYSYFPSSDTVGNKIGNNLAVTHGAQWSNSTIDFVTSKFFDNKKPTISAWSWEGLVQYFKGSAQKGIGETLKLTLTPKLMPYLTTGLALTGQAVLPMAVGLIGMIYQRYAHDPQKAMELSKLTIDELFTKDEETGLLRDPFGVLLSKNDIKDICRTFAEYQLVSDLLELTIQIEELYNTIDQETEIPDEAKKIIQGIADKCLLRRSDGKIFFLDGKNISKEEEKKIKQGIKTLANYNPTKKDETIHEFIQLLAKHSVPPTRYITGKDLEENTTKSGKMRPIFPEPGEDSWKNYIIRGNDGIYYLGQTVGEKEAGTIIEPSEMKEIFIELIKKEEEISLSKQKNLQELIMTNKSIPDLLDQLNKMSDVKEVRKFFLSYLIKRENDGKQFYPNGKIVENNFLEKVEQLRPRQGARKDQIEELLNQISKQFPEQSSLSNNFIIKCDDDIFMNPNGKVFNEKEVEKIDEILHLKIIQENSENKIKEEPINKTEENKTENIETENTEKVTVEYKEVVEESINKKEEKTENTELENKEEVIVEDSNKIEDNQKIEININEIKIEELQDEIDPSVVVDRCFDELNTLALFAEGDFLYIKENKLQISQATKGVVFSNWAKSGLKTYTHLFTKQKADWKSISSEIEKIIEQTDKMIPDLGIVGTHGLDEFYKVIDKTIGTIDLLINEYKIQGETRYFNSEDKKLATKKFEELKEAILKIKNSVKNEANERIKIALEEVGTEKK